MLDDSKAKIALLRMQIEKIQHQERLDSGLLGDFGIYIIFVLFDHDSRRQYYNSSKFTENIFLNF